MENITDEKYIGLICNGEFNAIPDFKIGELFESFFDNINYNVVKENDIFVDFTGEAFCDDEPCTILMRFKILDDLDTFEIAEVKVNDEVLSEEEILDLIDDIAFISGAIMENDDYCSHDCSHCSSNCINAVAEVIDEEDDGYDFEEDNDSEDDEENDEE